MAPRLRVLVSTPSQPYPPTQLLAVNTNTPTAIKTPGFEGSISVWVKDYTGDEKKGEGEEYFGQESRKGMTYAIVTRGRFLDAVDADELVFGNLFEKPIKSQLPWGSSIAIKAMHFLDPTLEIDIYADKPWALSPTLATFNYLSLHADEPEYTPSIEEESLERLGDLYQGESPPPGTGMSSTAEAAARKRWLGYKEHREGVVLDKSTWVGMEFCNGYLDFNTLSAKLPPPFNLSFPLLQYWDGQPVTYVCKKRAPPGAKDQTEGEVYFAVAFEIIDEEAKKLLEEKGLEPVSAAGTRKGDGKAEEEDEGEDKFENAESGDSDLD